MTTAQHLALLFVAAIAWHAEGRTEEQPAAISKPELAKRYPELKLENIHDSPIPGLYEVAFGNTISYVTTDGRFLIRGDIVSLDNQTNVTEGRRAESRAALLAAIDPATEIVFSPPDGAVKYRVTIFTDVDCGYCRQFHRSIADVNALGIEVHYVSYPRTGPNTDSWRKAEGVWCAADRNGALTAAKSGADVAPVAGCTSAPVAAEYELGRRVGVPGTPAIYSESGAELGGYLSPTELLAQLQKIAAP